MNELTPEQNTLLTQWNNSKTQLDAWKEAESADRKAVIAAFSLTAEDASGTETVEIGNGYRLKISKSLDYKLDNTDGKLDKALEGYTDGVAALLVKWEPKLSVSAYKTLPEDEQLKIYDCLTIKPSSPQVKVEPPKVSK